MSRVSERNDATGDESSADLAAILRDEEFVDSLLGDGNVSTSSVEEYELATLIVGARKDVVHTPMPAAPSEDELAAALAEGISQTSKNYGAGPRGGRRRRWLTTVTAGAASVAVLLGGIAIAGNYFGTESPTSESSQDVVTVAQIRSDLNLAQRLMEKGDRQGSIELLNATTKRMEQLERNGEFSELNARRVHLWSQATGLPESRAPEVGSDPTVPPVATDDPTVPPASEGAAPEASQPQQPQQPQHPQLPQLPPLPTELPQLPPLPSHLQLPQLPELPEVQIPGMPQVPPMQQQQQQQQLQAPDPSTTSTPSSTTTPSSTGGGGSSEGKSTTSGPGVEKLSELNDDN